MGDLDTALLQYLTRIETKLDAVSTELNKVKLKCAENNCVRITLGAREWGIIASMITVICTTATAIAKVIVG